MASVDWKVLEAQKWLNKTYADDLKVNGYNRVLEDGITGWQTMYGLIRALQYEIGITQLADAFGPTTFSTLQARGGIDDWDNGNLVHIVQCAFYCKGYSTGGIDGVWEDETTEAATAMCINAGIYTGEDVKKLTPKMLKSLFSMDAHTLLVGGSEAIRAFQQWLNSRYLSMQNFYIVPADGLFSRDVQKALYLSIQSEMKLPDASATGTFGPATKAYIRGQELRPGSGGPLVQIFTGAMICQRVKTSNGLDFTRFTSGFDSVVSDAVRTFQTFSELPTTGYGDYATWCQLLVSTGDPDRPGTAFDCSTPLTTITAQALRQAGYQYVGRYLDNVGPNTLNKKLQPGELATIFGSGLRVFPISQYNGTSLEYFNFSRGRQDALLAHTAALSYGFPYGTVIYFAVDFDATQAQINSNIIDYFRGVRRELSENGKIYIHGVYGSRNVCADVSRQTSARYSFVSGMSSGYSGNMGFPLPENWSFNQIQNLKFNAGGTTIEIDKNIHRTGSDRGVDNVEPPGTSPSTAERFINYVAQLHAFAKNYAAARPGLKPNRLVLQFLRHPQYTDASWQGLFGPINWDFITAASVLPLIRVTKFQDETHPARPILHVAHLAATCNIVYDLGQPLDPSGKLTTVDLVDISGWGGDWVSFYGDWVRDGLPPPAAYCKTYLAKSDAEAASIPNYRSHFRLRDLLEDVDGYNIGIRLRTSSASGQEPSIVDELTRLYLGDSPAARTRFRDFTAGRFGPGDWRPNAKALALKMLTPSLLANSEQFIGGVKAIIWSVAGVGAVEPGGVGAVRLEEFAQGFVDMMNGMVGREIAGGL